MARKDVHHETSNLTGLAEVLRQQGKEVVSQVLPLRGDARPAGHRQSAAD